MMATDKQVEAALDAWCDARASREEWRHTSATDHDDMRAALEAAEDAAWEPIETAPRDGTRLILGGHWDNGGLPGDGEWTEEFASWGSLSSSSSAPCEWMIGLGPASRFAVRWTLWRPLLAPPKERAP